MTDVHALTGRLSRELTSEAEALAALEAADRLDPVPSPPEIEGAFPEKGVTVGLHRLLARSLAAAGRPEDADRVLFQIAERLNQAGYWRAMTLVVRELLPSHAHQAAPLILRARTEGGEAAVEDALLLEAHAHHPHHGHLAWAAARVCTARGDAGAARRAARLAFPELLEDRSYAEAEEALLLAVESEDAAGARSSIRALEILARHGEWERFATVLDVASDLLGGPEGIDAAWPVLQGLWLRHPAPEAMRGAMVRLAEAFLSRYPDPAALLRTARLAVPSEDPAACLERLRKAALFPPGWYAAHATWGIGGIRENDAEAVVIDFPAKPVHRMTLATAERALEALDPEDLRVLRAHRPEELARLVRDEPATVVARALRRLPGCEATADKLRKLLVPDVIPSPGWTGWWKSTRAAVAADPRIDARRAYENIFRLRRPGEGAEAVALPEWNDGADTFRNLALLETFLEHHPDAAVPLLDAFGPRLAAFAADAGGGTGERVAAALWLRRAGADPGLDPAGLVKAGFDPNLLAREDQEELVDLIEEPEGLATLLASRIVAVRRAAWARLRDRRGDEPAARAALAAAAERPEAALHLLEEAVPGDQIPAGAAWTTLVLAATADLLELAERDTHRKRALALLDRDAPFGRRIAAAPLGEDDALRFTTRLKGWRSSDKYRFPLVDFLRAAGHAEIADEVDGHRARSAARLAQRSVPGDDPYEGDLVLTRATLGRLEGERTRIGMELKTAIPAAIQKARELGDLRENAEYAAAKAKQIEYAKRFQELETMLQRVRLLETLPREAGVALPGTEIRLEAADGGPPPRPESVWLLGEGDQTFGETVISYRAAVGKALLGRREGDEIAVVMEGTDRRLRIAAVRERLP